MKLDENSARWHWCVLHTFRWTRIRTLVSDDSSDKKFVLQLNAAILATTFRSQILSCSPNMTVLSCNLTLWLIWRNLPPTYTFIVIFSLEAVPNSCQSTSLPDIGIIHQVERLYWRTMKITYSCVMFMKTILSKYLLMWCRFIYYDWLRAGRLGFDS